MSTIFDWAKPENLQPEPITVEIWRQLPEDFCRLVELVNGEAVRAESPTRGHQTVARRLANLLESASGAHMSQYQDGCLDVGTDFDVLLWERPRATLRRPDAAVFECAPNDLRPLPASMVKLAVEVISPGTEQIDLLEKKGEYALAGIHWYWIVWIADDRVTSIETHVLDITRGQYRPHQVLVPHSGETTITMPIRISFDWGQLAGLTP